MNFLPEKYQIPVSLTGYMKLKPGENRFRVLSSAIVGWKAWATDKDGEKKVLRWRTNEEPKVRPNDTKDRIKHFWAFVVWNYNEEKIQILEITQKGLMKTIQSLVKDKDWGEPFSYDIVITRKGEGLGTEYQVSPKPKSKIDEGIVRFYQDLNIKLEKLFDGEDPFSNENSNLDEVKKIFSK